MDTTERFAFAVIAFSLPLCGGNVVAPTPVGWKVGTQPGEAGVVGVSPSKLREGQGSVASRPADLTYGEPAIDHDDLTGDVARGGRIEKDGCSRHVIRGSQAA